MPAMHTIQTGTRDRAIARWLLIGVIMIIIQVILGGITRLTGSGLSITEWDLVTGTLPPLNHAQWQEAFDKYRNTEQYRQLNSGFTLPDFQFIFFWEWFHRLWGRLIGIVFAIPFVYFLVKKRFSKDMILPLVILFLLGALQGAVGWIMVVSGLTGDAIYVRPARLGLHFILALVLLAYTYWFMLKFYVREQSFVLHKGLRNFTWIILVILFIQLFYGALMAGYRAAPYAPTWPDINGEMIPSALSQSAGQGDERQQIFITHFIHRSLAYLLVLLVIGWTVVAFRTRGSAAFRKTRWFPMLFVVLQSLLGILTVFSSIAIRPYRWNEFEWMAQLHQLTALFLLLSLVHELYLLSKINNKLV